MNNVIDDLVLGTQKTLLFEATRFPNAGDISEPEFPTRIFTGFLMRLSRRLVFRMRSYFL
jgi:hypothetical protein